MARSKEDGFHLNGWQTDGCNRGDIKNIIKSLKTKNYHGYDEISVKLLKICSPYICSPLTYICITYVIHLLNLTHLLKFLTWHITHILFNHGLWFTLLE